MSELNTKLQEIKLQKDTYLTPGNIKKYVTILGVTGTYEGSGGSSMKEYQTESAMNADISNIQEGEVVKVLTPSVAYYIKDTTMQLLIEEGPIEDELTRLTTGSGAVEVSE